MLRFIEIEFLLVTVEQFNSWCMYTCYICNLATNSGGCRSFLEKAKELNLDFTFLDEIIELYRYAGNLWNDKNGKDLEAIGAGFNITLESLQNKEKCKLIGTKLREFADCMDQVVSILEEHLR